MTGNPTQEVFDLVLARPVVTAAGEHPHFVHLWWRLNNSPRPEEMLVQVYLNGSLAAITRRPEQREFWLVCDRSRLNRVELLAVSGLDADAAWTPRPELLASWTPSLNTEAEAALVRDERLAVDTQIVVKLDGEVVDRGPLWPVDEHRGGFGALFGLGEFGRDNATGPGLGGGELGMGPLGADGTAWRWGREGLAPGTHGIELTAVDQTGQPAAQPAAMDGIETEAPPAPAEKFAIASDFTLTWTH